MRSNPSGATKFVAGKMDQSFGSLYSRRIDNGYDERTLGSVGVIVNATSVNVSCKRSRRNFFMK